MNYVERHFGDWARDTAHLSMLEDGAYNRLCDLYYVRETPLPKDLPACCRLVRAVSKPERDAVRSVLEEFFYEAEDGWRHKRCDEEIDRFRAKSGKAAASANARWKKGEVQSERNANASANAMRTHSDGNANGMPRARAGGRAPTPQAPNTIPTESKTPRGRGSRLPIDWTPGDTGFAFAAQQGLANGKAQAELEKFRDHWTAATGQKATKADWQAAWRTWIRNSIEFARNGKSGTPGDYSGNLL